MLHMFYCKVTPVSVIMSGYVEATAQKEEGSKIPQAAPMKKFVDQPKSFDHNSSQQATSSVFRRGVA